MLTSKQRAYLRGLANDYDTILQIGKGGNSYTIIKQVDDALTAREMIKMRVLETCPLTSREAADEISQAVGADVVQVIGSKFILFRRNPQNPKIELKKK